MIALQALYTPLELILNAYKLQDCFAYDVGLDLERTRARLSARLSSRVRTTAIQGVLGRSRAI